MGEYIDEILTRQFDDDPQFSLLANSINGNLQSH